MNKMLDLIRHGVEFWNTWKGENSQIIPNLSGLNLEGLNLSRADLSSTLLSFSNLTGVNLSQTNLKNTLLIQSNVSEAILANANLTDADLDGAILKDAYAVEANFRNAVLTNADLSGINLSRATLASADLSGTNLNNADLNGVDLRGANLSGANLTDAYAIGADFTGANLSGAKLEKADLTKGVLVSANLERASLSNCRIYGLSAWDINLHETKQADLIITPENQPIISVDDLEVAQFIYLLLNNKKIRNAIDSVTSKAVLILGRFTEERKTILDCLREELRKQNYLPILFDFENAQSRDLAETVSTLAHLARFIIADITDAKTIADELRGIIPFLPSVVVQPIILKNESAYANFVNIKRYPWVLPIYEYESQEHLLNMLTEKIILPAESKVTEQRTNYQR